MRKTIPLLAFALLAAPAFAADITINNLAQLRAFMENVRYNDFRGDTIKLTTDIDCQGGRFNTGDPEHPTTFRGTFDGQGHTISNFVHEPNDRTDFGYGIAMFDYAELGATIRNLTLEGSLPDTHLGAYSAPFVLAVEGPFSSLLLDNCHFRGSVTNYQQAAGLVGYVNSAEGSAILTNCSVRGSIVSTWVSTAGGLVAESAGVEAYDCSVEGEVRGGTSGGLVGEAYGNFFKPCSFERCSFEGVTGPYHASSGVNGGLVGQASNAVFRACTSVVGFDDVETAAGGAAGVTFGSTAFYDCSATVEAAVPYGRFGGFVGWTVGAETFSNCTATMTVDPVPVINTGNGTTNIYSLATGGFAASVSSYGALFVDCTATAQGSDLKAGFYYSQKPWAKAIPLGQNTFRRCHAVNPAAKEAGFCLRAWNCAFEGCTVRGGTGRAGFVQSAGGQPDDQWDTEYSYAQTSTFTDCSVYGTRARYGFVEHANYSSMNGHTNIFRRCRAGCLYGNSNLSGATVVGFGSLNKGTLAEDCAAYGIADMGHLEAGFASSISVGATVRRCVGAVYPRSTDTQGAGFAEVISYTATVEDCYAVYAPYASAVNLGSEDAWRYGVQGGFVRRTSIGYNADDLPIARCFALWPLSEPNSGEWISGSFCGVTPYDTSTDYFEDCYRPAEAAIGSCHNADAEGVTALTKAEFATATRATMPNYDFDNVWHEPAAVGASSPYLDASVDADTNFWFFSAVIGAEGRILVNGEEPREAYPAGTALTVSAAPDTPGMPFAGWVGDGFADPSAQTTTYTVKNVSAIAAKFCTPIYTVDDWTNMVHASYESSPTDAYALMNDLDFTDYIASNGWNYVDGYYAFAGKLFGQGYTIRGLVATNGSFTTTRALFSSLANGAEIRDLTIEFGNVPSDQNTLSMAGLAASVGSGVLISNCHVKADWQGVCDNHGYPSCLYYGLAQTVSGTNIRIVDCTVEGKLAGGTRACGFVGSATLNGGEIARCAVFADVSTLTNHTDGIAVGFAGDMTLSGGAVVRECFSAGTVDAAGDAAGFAHQIDMRDDESQVRDCYSTAEVLAGVGQNPAGFACRISDINDAGGVLPLANCWFGGTIRCRGKASDYYKPYGFAYYLSGDVSFENCAWIEAPGANEAGTAGVTALPQAESRKAASWPGYDFTNVWSMAEDSTTPYFAWSLAEGTDFRLFAMQEPGKTITIPESAAPGSTNAISAVADDNLFLCGWAGGAFYTDAAVTPSALVADNHRTARCVWGKAITTRAELAAITNDLTGVYGLGADIDLAEGGNWTPIGNSEYNKAFAGTLYGQGHAISNLVVDTEGTSYAGLFGYIDHATITDVRLVNPVVRGGAYAGALAGYATGASVSDCSAENATVEATGERAGMLVGSVSGSSLSRCSALGSVSSAGRYVGGFAGCAENGSSFSRCFALGSVSSTGGNYNGGFVGYLDGSSASECFACGEVAMSGRNYIGGFVGYASGTSPVSDCYALADVTANRYVGGFAGYATGSGVSFTRCYSAGSTVGSQDIGSFAGYQSSSPTFADCFRPDDGLADVGAADLNGIDALDAAGFLDADNFEDWTAPGGKWTQTDGKTQPYFAWGLVDGKMTLSGKVAGTGGGSISGLGAYAPGTVVPLAAVPSGNAFVGWLGNAPYANASAQSTTIPLDNFRVVTALFGTAISTAEELLAVTNDLAGIYVLTKDIDFGGATIPPLGDDTTAFSGSFYGRNHCLSNFVVESTAKYIGLFGRISGGRVSGVVAKGTVSGAAPAGTGWQYTGTGGFAGAILADSLVEDCSFEGAVTNATAYNTGGFVGYVAGTPGIRRCCFAGTVAHLGSKDEAGGFVGCPNGGSIADCYAVADVEAGARSYVGGFAGYMGSSAAIATSWCAGRVETTASNYKGAFAGSASAGKITNSYYDSDKTSLLAVNKAAYNGVTALTSAQMLHETNFIGFDFAKTWKIDEGETTPYLRAFLAQRTAFAAWLEDELNLPPDTDPLTVVNGVPLLARYVYGILPLTGQTDADGHPLVDFGVDADGAPWFSLAPQKMADEYGMQFSVLWSPNLADDWIRDPGDEWPKEIRFDADTDGDAATCHPPVDADIDPQMFFKYRIVIDD